MTRPTPARPAPSGAPTAVHVPEQSTQAPQPTQAASAPQPPPSPAPAAATRWPDVARRPTGRPGHTATARLLLGRALKRMPLSVRYGPPRAGARYAPDVAGGPPVLRLHDPEAFYRRIGSSGLIGFGESYMAGEWDSDDLPALLTVLATHADELVPAPLRRLRPLWVQARPDRDRNTRRGARANVQHHYDLSNDLFATFLDPTLSYSAALFTAFPARFESLPAAQHRKIDRLLDLAGVTDGTRLLEIGTGWGELALRAAARGARVTTLTLSAEQAALARRRVAEHGLADRVDIQLRDYREHRDTAPGRYDAVVSVEMVEAVGAEYWPVYFDALRAALAPGGRIALQSITMGHQQMLDTAATHTWISKYVFPGGLIPSRLALAQHARAVGLHLESDEGYGEHYAETLRLWRERFTANAPAVAALGFDSVFRRMWEFYLAYSEAGFRSRYLDVRQIVLREGTPR